MQTHALLRIDSADAVCGETAVPLWVGERLARARWGVVRRTRGRDGLVPVGVRGGTRAERFAGWVCPGKVREYLTPPQLAARRGWRGHPRRVQIAALAVLDEVESIMARARLGSHWGPAGSVAFELASGCATASCASDADLVLLPGEP